MPTLHVRQDAGKDGETRIRLTLKRVGQPDQDAEARIRFGLTEQEQEDIRWYLEDYLQRADTVEPITVRQIEEVMKSRGEELHAAVLAANDDTRALWYSVRNSLTELRVEIASGVAEAASIPWELMRDPKLDSAVALRVKSFVRVQSNPAISFVEVPPLHQNRIRLLYVACRPSGSQDVELRAVANRLLQDLGQDRARFDIKALRPPTFEQLQRELTDAKEAQRPYHIVHFDGHGIYADLSDSRLADWLPVLPDAGLDSNVRGKRGYLLFEHPSEDNMRPVDGQTLGQLLHDSGVPVLVLNACQSAMHEADAVPQAAGGPHDEIRAIGSLSQAVIDQGIPAVLGMRYSVYVVTAAQYIGQLYAALAKGRSFGQAATEGRKHLHLNPDRWIGLQPRPLQDWIVPVIYEAAPIEFFATAPTTRLGEQPDLDPVQRNRSLLRYVPEEGFIGRDETVLALDRALDEHRVVLLHGYAGQGKTSTAVEFARWYGLTGGLGDQPLAFFASFETHTDLDDLLNQIGQPFASFLESQGIYWSALNGPDERRQVILQVLRHFPLLWIWDNVEGVAGFPEGTESQWTDAEQSELRQFLKQIKLDAAGRARILITSRRDEQTWLGGIPHRIPMPRMREADVARLALTLGEEHGLKRSQLADWQALLKYCAGNPLTLRVIVGQAVRERLRGRRQIEDFVEGIRSGERRIEDADERQGRDRSLGASLDYGFRRAFKPDELPIVALLHLFQGTVEVAVLRVMGAEDVDYTLPELVGKTEEDLTQLLMRAKETGLLTQLAPTRFAIHPALPWFLAQLFASNYDGRDGRSTSQAAIRAWFNATAAMGSFFHQQFVHGEQTAMDVLEIEEANLLHALRLAHRNQAWDRVVSSMQGLRKLYEYQGRYAEWARLVEWIRPDYCTAEDDPVPGREAQYSLVMDYRVTVARRFDRDSVKAAVLQEKTVAHDRRQAASAIAVPAGALLTDEQRYSLTLLGASLSTLGQILMEENDPSCLEYLKEALDILRRSGNKAAEASVEFYTGHAYNRVSAIRDLDAAEAAFRRALNLANVDDALSRAQSTVEIGRVQFARFREARDRDEPGETLVHYAQEAERCYLEGLRLCPDDSLTDLAPIHNALANLYSQVGEFDLAREHYERDAQYEEMVGNPFGAGQTRYSMAVMYRRIAGMSDQPARQRASLLRGRAYAEAALRDFQRYDGRRAKDEADTQLLLERINEEIADLSG